MVSGRVSFEIVQKAAVAGVPIVCAVSAPSDLAVETAERLGVTLVGFLRGDGFNVYSHDRRIDLHDLTGWADPSATSAAADLASAPSLQPAWLASGMTSARSRARHRDDAPSAHRRDQHRCATRCESATVILAPDAPVAPSRSGRSIGQPTSTSLELL